MAGKFALLLGNDQFSDEQFSSLTVPCHDVQALKTTLENPAVGGFDQVDILLNGSLEKVMAAVGDLFANRNKDDLLLLYFSGHGALDQAGQLYLAVNQTQYKRLSSTALSASFIKNEMNSSRSRRQVLIFDCCHSGAFGRDAVGAKTALAADAINESTFEVKGYGREILVSSSATQLSWEGHKILDKTNKSLFTHYLVEGLNSGKAALEGKQDITVGQLYDYAYEKVVSAASNMTPQRWVDKLQGSIIIAKNPHPQIKARPLPKKLLAALEDDQPFVREGAVRELGRIMEGEDKRLAGVSRQRLLSMQEKERDRFVHKEITEVLNSTNLRNQPELSAGKGKAVKNPQLEIQLRQACIVFQDKLKVGGVGPEMQVIPKGKFRMGDIQGDGIGGEQPVHQVNIIRPFAMSKYPVTFDDYATYVKDKCVRQPGDEGWGQGNRPVTNVSWKEAVVYALWLSVQTGKAYRLPSEAEWEYAARAGAETTYWWGNDIGVNNTNCRGSGSEWSGKKTSPVDSFKANPFGLHDMSGNVWEWVQDAWHNDYQGAPEDGSVWEGGDTFLCVLRGGSWNSEPGFVRLAYRNRYIPDPRSSNVGFRLAQDL